jgi:hypothetical protein
MQTECNRDAHSIHIATWLKSPTAKRRGRVSIKHRVSGALQHGNSSNNAIPSDSQLNQTGSLPMLLPRFKSV